MKKAFVFDIDGTLYYIANQPRELIKGAAELTHKLAKQKIPYCFVTNTTSRSAVDIYKEMAGLGFAVEPWQVITPTVVTAQWLKQQGYSKIAIEYCPALHPEFSQFELSQSPQAVVLADDGNGLDYSTINRVINYARQGAKLVCLQRNKVYKKDSQIVVDLGYYVAGFEFVTGQTVQNFGKPSPQLFNHALTLLGNLNANQVAMVGDDIEADVLGACDFGLYGVLVRTGKYHKGQEDNFSEKPDIIIDSVAAIGEWL